MKIFTLLGALIGSACTVSAQTANISPEWQVAYVKAKAAVAKMSLQDKVNLATGVGWGNGKCIGNTPAVSSIRFPGLCLQGKRWLVNSLQSHS
jgi:beta-glucosidase